mmetsp:Transcript_29122/g.65948  ORF Transcript_29122/g.65948 Transcript_29122/m.65948 type:complete len:205 (-) Transcript_29122:390-1004(-)
MPGGELKVSTELPTSDALEVDNVKLHLERINKREARFTASDSQFMLVAKSRMYPWADRNQRKKRLDIVVKRLVDISAIRVPPHGLIGQTFDQDEIAVDGMLDDYTGMRGPGLSHRQSVVITKAMGEGTIEGVAADYEIDPSEPFSTRFKFSRWGLRAAAPRNISLLSGKKRKVVKTKGFSVSASVEHDVTDMMAKAMGGGPEKA